MTCAVIVRPPVALSRMRLSPWDSHAPLSASPHEVEQWDASLITCAAAAPVTAAPPPAATSSALGRGSLPLLLCRGSMRRCHRPRHRRARPPTSRSLSRVGALASAAARSAAAPPRPALAATADAGRRTVLPMAPAAAAPMDGETLRPKGAAPSARRSVAPAVHIEVISAGESSLFHMGATMPNNS